MENEKLITKLTSYMQENSLKNAKVEKDIGLPKNSLSNFLSLKKSLPNKWAEPILKYISQSNIVINTLGDLSDKVTTADKISAPDNYKKEKWILEIENYCAKEGILPEDLILSHTERNKPQKQKKSIISSNAELNASLVTKNENKDHSNWFNDYRKNKLGLK